MNGVSKEEQFLREYEYLCQKYKMGLQGCGCCGSPFLNNNDKNDVIEDINYNKRLDKVVIGGDGYWCEKELKGTLNEADKDIKEKTIDEYFI